jgi:hypothetical protein
MRLLYPLLPAGRTPIQGVVLDPEGNGGAGRLHRHIVSRFLGDPNPSSFLRHRQSCVELSFGHLAISQVKAPPAEMQVTKPEGFAFAGKVVGDIRAQIELVPSAPRYFAKAKETANSVCGQRGAPTIALSARRPTMVSFLENSRRFTTLP